MITVIASDPIAPMRRPIEGAQRNPGRKVLRKICTCPLHVAPMLPGPGTGAHALTPFRSHITFCPLPLNLLQILPVLLQLLAVVWVHAFEGHRGQIGHHLWHRFRIALAVIHRFLIVQPCLLAACSFFRPFPSSCLRLLPPPYVLLAQALRVVLKDLLQAFQHRVHTLGCLDELGPGLHRQPRPPVPDQCFCQQWHGLPCRSAAEITKIRWWRNVLAIREGAPCGGLV